ncbi:MAG: hypothetical protein GXP03_08495 [Alphaproteobacteria bacterium]|nr:hypothetical protein [Alphaproteobacteria bacterium]
MFRIATLLVLFTTPLLAQEVISPEKFRAYAEGKTLYFAQKGAPYGVEQYFPGQKSIWQYADGTCARGIWYARKELICFLYEGDNQEQCWRFLQDGERYAARADGNAPEDDLFVVGRDEKDILCKAPDLGV